MAGLDEMTLPTIELAPPPETAAESRPATAGEWPNPYDAPLKVVALALHSLRSRGKASDIKKAVMANTALTEQEYKAWWDGIPTVLRAAPDFKEKNGTYSLLGSPDGVPAVPLPPKPKKAKAPAKPKPKTGKLEEWVIWLSGPEDAPPPYAKPHSDLIKGIGKGIPEVIPEHGLRLVVGGCNTALSENEVYTPADWRSMLVAWLDLLVAVARRWNSEFGNSGASAPTGTASGVFRLWQAIPAGKRREQLIRKIASLLNSPSGLRPGFATTLWALFSDTTDGVIEANEGSRLFANRLAVHTEADARIELWQKIAEFGLRYGDLARRNHTLSELFGVLNAVDASGEKRILRRLLHKSSEEGAPSPEALLDFANRHTDILLAGLLLLDTPPERVLRQGADRLHSAIAYGNTPGEPISSTVAKLTQTARERVEDTLARNANSFRQDLEKAQTQHQAEVAGMNQQMGELNREARDLHAQLARGRDEFVMEARYDVLKQLALAFQHLHRADASVSELVQDAKSNLLLALGAGGAQEFGAVGELTEFNPQIHHGADGLAAGDKVRITLPGIKVLSSSDEVSVLRPAETVSIQEGE